MWRPVIRSTQHAFFERTSGAQDEHEDQRASLSGCGVQASPEITPVVCRVRSLPELVECARSIVCRLPRSQLGRLLSFAPMPLFEDQPRGVRDVPRGGLRRLGARGLRSCWPRGRRCSRSQGLETICPFALLGTCARACWQTNEWAGRRKTRSVTGLCQRRSRIVRKALAGSASRASMPGCECAPTSA